MSDAPCQRCGGTVPTRDNLHGSSFWGLVVRETETTTVERLRFRSTYIRDEPLHGSPVLRCDEAQALCSDCWGLLVGRFMQGRDVPAMAGKEGR